MRGPPDQMGRAPPPQVAPPKKSSSLAAGSTTQIQKTSINCKPDRSVVDSRSDTMLRPWWPNLPSRCRDEPRDPPTRTGRTSRQDRRRDRGGMPSHCCAGTDRVRQDDRGRTPAAASPGRWPSRHHHGAGPKSRRSDGREAIRGGRHQRWRHPGFSPDDELGAADPGRDAAEPSAQGDPRR